MEAICVKLDENILKNVDETIKKNNYSTRTDFIREAIRDKLKEIEKENAIKKLEQYLGKAKTKTTDERHEQVREQVAKEYAKKLGIKL